MGATPSTNIPWPSIKHLEAGAAATLRATVGLLATYGAVTLLPDALAATAVVVGVVATGVSVLNQAAPPIGGNDE